MKLAVLVVSFAAAALSIVLAAPPPTWAAKQTTLQGCIVIRSGAAAVMRSTDGSLVALDLSGVARTPFSLKPDECFTISGLVPDDQRGTNVGGIQTSYLVQVWTVSNLDSQDHPKEGQKEDTVNPGSEDCDCP